MGSSKSKLKKKYIIDEMINVQLKSKTENDTFVEKKIINTTPINYYDDLEESVRKIRLILDCDDWRNNSDLAWNDINEINFDDIRYVYNLSQEDIELILKNCGINLNKLMIEENCDSTIMPTINKYCKNLEQFEFHLNYINEDDFIDAFTSMTKLKSLTVRTDSVLGPRRDEPVDMTKILSSLSNEINQILLLTDKGTLTSSRCLHYFPKSLERFNNLCHLSLKMFKLDDNAIKEISNRKTLMGLEFDCCTFEGNISLILNLPKLELLTLESMKNFDDFIINISNESKHLNYLSIINCKNVSNNALKQLSNLDNLEHLNLQNLQSIQDDVFTDITDKLKKLAYLNISRCQNITGNVLVKLTNLKNLEYLDIRRIENINDDVIINIGNSCKKLKHLYIQSCKNVTSDALNELSKLENLETLYVVDVDNVGDEMFKDMYKLKILRCNWCPNVTDVGIMRVIENATRLETLMLCRTGITSTTLVCAADVTKKRTNNVCLEIIITSKVLKDYQLLEHDSGPLITMRGRNMCCHDC